MMENMTKMFELAMNTQTQMMENFMETSQKLPNFFGKADFMEKSSEAYKSYFEKNQSIVEESLKAMEAEMGTNFFADFMKSANENMSNFNETMTKSVKDMVENIPSFQGFETYETQVKEMYETMSKTYADVMEKMPEPFKNVGFNPVEFMKETHQRFIETSKEYMKNFEQSSKPTKTKTTRRKS